MIKHFYSSTGDKLIRVEDTVPQCGDSCGDCLHCSDDVCYGNEGGNHFWVVYIDEEDADDE